MATGATVHEALKAHAQLGRDGVHARVIDAYSIKPIDVAALRETAGATGALVTVEDHYPAGGLGEAVLAALADRPVPVTIMAVRKLPMSGRPDEQRQHAGISADAIVETCKRLVTTGRGAGTAAPVHQS